MQRLVEYFQAMTGQLELTFIKTPADQATFQPLYHKQTTTTGDTTINNQLTRPQSKPRH